MACMHPAGGHSSIDGDGEDRKGKKRERGIAAAGAAGREAWM